MKLYLAQHDEACGREINSNRHLTDQGLAVLLVSSELPELMGMSDRILMLAEGQIGGAFEGSAITQEALLAAAMGQGETSPPAFSLEQTFELAQRVHE